MNSFSIKRFCRTFRWMLMTNLQKFLAYTAGCAAAVFLLELIIIAFSVHADGLNYHSFLYSSLSQFCQIFLIIYVLVAISTLFSYYLKKPQREAFLMLPATHLEKFLSAVIYVTVVWSLAGFLAFAVGDTLRMAVRALAYGNEWYSLVPRLLELFGEVMPSFPDGGVFVYTTSYKVVVTMWIIGWIVWFHSTFLLGGTLLRRYSFAASSLVIILFIVVLVWFGHKYNLQVFYVETMIDGQSEAALRASGALATNGPIPAETVQVFNRAGAAAYIVAILLPLFSIFNYWASYHIFKGFQLITNKWTNYDFFK